MAPPPPIPPPLPPQRRTSIWSWTRPRQRTLLRTRSHTASRRRAYATDSRSRALQLCAVLAPMPSGPHLPHSQCHVSARSLEAVDVGTVCVCVVGCMVQMDSECMMRMAGAFGQLEAPVHFHIHIHVSHFQTSRAKQPSCRWRPTWRKIIRGGSSWRMLFGMPSTGSCGP